MKKFSSVFAVFVMLCFVCCPGCEKEPPPPVDDVTDTTAVTPFRYDSLYCISPVFLNDVIDVSAHAAGDDLTYTWTIDVGTLLGSGNVVTFSACCQGIHNITCTVEDKYGNSGTKSIVIKVV